MVVCRRFFICLALVMTVSTSAAQLELGVLDLKPWGYRGQDAEIKGTIADMLRQLAFEANYPYRLRIAPQSRLLHDLESGAVDLAVLIDDEGSNAVAEALVRLPGSPVLLVLRKGLSFEQLGPNTKIGQVRGSVFVSSPRQIPSVEMVFYNKTSQGLAMMQRGRLDGFVSSAAAYSGALKELGQQALAEDRIVILGEVNGAIFLSRQSSYIGQLERLKRAAQRVAARILARAQQAE